MTLGPITISVSLTQGSPNYSTLVVNWSAINYGAGGAGPNGGSYVTVTNIDNGATVYNSVNPNVNGGSATITGLTPSTTYQAVYFVETYTTSADYVSKRVTSTIGTAAAPLPVWSGSYVDGVEGTAYSDTATASNSVTSYTLYSGSLPPGLSLSKSGSNALISGTPTTRGTYSFILRATNAYGSTNKGYTIYIAGPDGEASTYNGTSWVQGPVYVYNGTTWALTPMYYYNGSSWALTKGT